MASNFTLAECMVKVGNREEMKKLTNSQHRCWSCAKAYGGCAWTRVDPKSGNVCFEDIPGWRVKRRVYTEGGRTVERVLVKACPEYVKEGP